MVEAVTDICPVELDGTMSWVGEKDFMEDPLEGMPKLHGLHGGKREGFEVNSRPCVVAYLSGAAVALWDDARW